MNEFIDGAIKLSSAGPVAILLVALFLAAWAIRRLYADNKEITEKFVTALTNNTAAMDAHTAAIQSGQEAAKESTRVARDSAKAIEALVLYLNGGDILSRQRALRRTLEESSGERGG